MALPTELQDNVLVHYITKNHPQIEINSAKELDTIVQDVMTKCEGVQQWTDLRESVLTGILFTSMITVPLEVSDLIHDTSGIICNVRSPPSLREIARRIHHFRHVCWAIVDKDTPTVNSTHLARVCYGMCNIATRFPVLETFHVALTVDTSYLLDDFAKEGIWIDMRSIEGPQSWRSVPSADGHPRLLTTVAQLTKAVKVHGPGKRKNCSLTVIRPEAPARDWAYTATWNLWGWKPWVLRSNDIDLDILEDTEDILRQAWRQCQPCEGLLAIPPMG